MEKCPGYQGTEADENCQAQYSLNKMESSFSDVQDFGAERLSEFPFTLGVLDYLLVCSRFTDLPVQQ